MTIYTTDPNDWLANDIDFDQAQGNISLLEKYNDIQGFFRTGWIPADQTWTFAADDDPTYTFIIAAFDATSRYNPGMRIKLTDTGTQYFIITKVVFDDPGSTITVYGGSVGDLSGGGITNPFFSVFKSPLDFSLDPDDWTEQVSDAISNTQGAPVAGTWYNPGGITLSIPIGVWNVEWMANIELQEANTAEYSIVGTLSTANNNESDSDFTEYALLALDSGTFTLPTGRRKNLNLATKTPYFLNIKTDSANIDNIRIAGDDSPSIVRAICALL